LSCAPTILNFRPRCAWRGSSFAPCGCGHRLGISGGDGIPRRSSTWSDHTVRADWSCRTAPAGGSMDPSRGNASSDSCVPECLPAPCRFFELDSVGGPRRRLDVARTWRMVGRCALVWMEACRTSGPKGPALKAFCRHSLTNRGPSHPRFSAQRKPKWRPEIAVVGLSPNATGLHNGTVARQQHHIFKSVMLQVERREGLWDP
jgi:hypothetical protein